VYFIERVLATVEERDGLEEVGLYRTVGAQRKVNHVLEQYFKQKNYDVLLDETTEVKTLTSALKGYLKELKDPLIPYCLYSKLIEASKNDQIEWVHQLLHQVPALNFRALKCIFSHLTRIVMKSAVNMMTSANLGTCIGSCLLKSENEMLSCVMEIKFVSHVTDLIIVNFDKIFGSRPNHDLKFEARAQRKRSNEMPAGQYRETELSNTGTKSNSTDSINSESSFGHVNRKSQNSKKQISESQLKRPTEFSAPAPAPFQNKNLCVRALYACVPDHETELAFQASQYITNVGLTDEPGWLRGTVNSKTGLFPANFVQMVDPMDCLRL
jgi:hypothetical protein